MSKASRDTKWRSRSTSWAGQIEPAGAAPDRPRLRGRTASEPHDGAMVGEVEGLAALGRSRRHDLDDLRDHVAGALDDDRVADAHVLARDLVRVVQRGARDHDAADGDRLAARPPASARRCGRPGSMIASSTVVGLLGRELVGDRPARRAADEAQPLLPVEAVDLVDHAVDVVGQRGALAPDLGLVGQHLVDRAAAAATAD